jgi:hypothetical protein
MEERRKKKDCSTITSLLQKVQAIFHNIRKFPSISNIFHVENILVHVSLYPLGP